MTFSVTAGASTQNTEQVFVELVPPAGVSIAIIKIRITMSTTNVGDQTERVRVYRETVLGSGGVSGTAVVMNPSDATSVTTVNIKTGTTLFTLGTTTDKLLDTAFNLRGTFEWIARDKDDYIWSNPGEALVVTEITTVSGSLTRNVEVFFVE
jgi:hypothetical protein